MDSRFYEASRRPFEQRVIPRQSSLRANSGYHSDDEVVESSRNWFDDTTESTFAPSLRIPKFVRRASFSGRPALHAPRLSFTKDSAGFLGPPEHTEHARSRSALGRRTTRTDFGSDDDLGRPRSHSKVRLPVAPARGRPSASSSGPRRDRGYPYIPLRPKEFRLIEIQPAKMSALKCKMFHASLEDPPSYVAISYAWGDTSDKKDIVVDGYTISLTTSLHGALDAVRRKTEPLLVWADALCINQQDEDERSQQIQTMTTIYTAATSVAVWLGPEDDDSSLAMELLRGVAERADSPESIKRAIFSQARQRDFDATVSLFARDYWNRLWVVQEVLNAQSITVFCGRAKLPWSVFTRASATFRRHKDDLLDNFSSYENQRGRNTLADMTNHARVLTTQGPSSLKVDISSLHETILTCRGRLASDGRDKVFGLLGLLGPGHRRDIPIDYSLSIKDVYTNVVDHVITTTERLDIICDAIHYPVCRNPLNLPTWLPDYSQDPGTLPIGRALNANFSAARSTKARVEILDDLGRRNKLQLSAVYLDTISSHGIAVGNLCRVVDFLMVFLQWRALLLGTFGVRDRDALELIQEDFAATLCLDQVPKRWKRPGQWLTVCYHAFASHVRELLPYLPLDGELDSFAETDVDLEDVASTRIVDGIGANMSGRCFCITETGLLGLGTGFMAEGDVVVVPFGCSTPILIRPEGNRGEYRYVGDVYVHGYMHGRAIDELEDGRRELIKYVLH